MIVTMTVVDDDSRDALPTLLRVLGEYDHELPLQLGDFVPSVAVNATHWKRPFACGGAGTVLSRTAVGRIEWGRCMRDFGGSCMQSDWMIGRCLEAANVTAVVGRGCGTCVARAGFAATAHSTSLLRRLRGGSCAFAQLPPGDDPIGTLFGMRTARSSVRRRRVRDHLLSVAVLHVSNLSLARADRGGRSGWSGCPAPPGSPPPPPQLLPSPPPPPPPPPADDDEEGFRVVPDEHFFRKPPPPQPGEEWPVTRRRDSGGL